MSVKILALALIIPLAHNVLILGLNQEKSPQHHVSWAEKSSVSVRQTPAKHRESWKTSIGMENKDTVQIKRALFQADNKDEKAQDEVLVKELALSSDIQGLKKSTMTAKGKRHKIAKHVHKKGKAGKIKTRHVIKALRVSERAHKRTAIAQPSSARDKSLPEHSPPISRTLLTAVGLLLDERNHFVKDSNALSLAKVLLDSDNSANEKHATVSSNSVNSVSSSGLPSGLGSNILRLLNVSSAQESQTGERKSTIHTELINPTQLGISILRLLFGHKAPLVTKPTYKPLFRYNPTVSSLSTALPAQRKQFDKVESVIRSKKHHKKSFTFALAKAVSDLIKSMAKEELKHYLQKIHQDPKLAKEVPSSMAPNIVWPTKKVVDVQGNRKSWVLLKIPKTGEEIVPPKDLSDEPLEEEGTDENRQAKSVNEHTGIVDTLGKLNDAQPVSGIGGIEGPLRGTVGNETRSFPSNFKVQPTTRVGYSVRILPSLKGSAVKQPDSYHVNRKPAAKLQSTTQNTAAFAEAVKKLLQAVQSSIKGLQGKQLIGYPTDLGSVIGNQLPSLQRAQSTNTGSVRGIRNDPTPVSYVQSYKKTPFLQDNKVQGKPRLGELSAFTRAAGQEEPLVHVHTNALFNPLKDLEMSPSEPITKSNSPTKPLGPSDNVLFESATQLGSPRDRQESSTVQHIKEDLETFAEKGLQAHNHYRQEHHSANLRWSDELATQAEKLAYDMAMRGVVERSEVATSMGCGENVAKITGVPFNDAGSVAADIWYSESRNYSYSYPRVTPQTDAFTQMVWKGTKEIGMGCAKDVATNDLYVVALYKPPGNDRKFLRENVINKGTMTQDVYATIFKRTQLQQNSTFG
ncbi:uncharacterized protein LOC144638816 [Oculina patagonica]